MARLTCEANLKGHSDDLDNRLLVPSACVPLYYVGDWRPEPVYSANSSSRYRENVNVQFIQVACEKCAQAEWQLFKATRYLRRTKRSTVERVRMRTVKCETSIFLTVMTLFHPQFAGLGKAKCNRDHALSYGSSLQSKQAAYSCTIYILQ